MEAVSRNAGRGGVSAGRLLWAGSLAAIGAVVVNLIIRTVAVAAFGLSGFLPLAVGPTVAFTVIGVFGAAVVFALVARFARDPVRLFRRVAFIVLLLSLIPDLSLLFTGSIPGTTVAGVLTLMTEHVATWAVSVGVLTTLGWRR